MDFNTDDILERMAEVLNIQEKRSIRNAIANDLGIKRYNVDMWINRGSVPLNLLFEFARNHKVSIYWLIDGSGDKDLYILDRSLLENVITETIKFVNDFSINWDEKTISKHVMIVYETELNSSSKSDSKSIEKILKVISKMS